MQPDDAGGGRDEGKDETHPHLPKANLKRKSSESNSKIMPSSIASGKKPKKLSKRRIKRHLKKTTTSCDQGFEVKKNRMTFLERCKQILVLSFSRKYFFSLFRSLK